MRESGIPRRSICTPLQHTNTHARTQDFARHARTATYLRSSAALLLRTQGCLSMARRTTKVTERRSWVEQSLVNATVTLLPRTNMIQKT